MMAPFLPQNFDVLGLSINTYGIFLGMGAYIVLVTVYNKYRDKLHIIDYFLIVLMTLAGARGLFLLHNIYKVIGGEIDIFDFSSGGFALYGAVMGLLISAVIVASVRKISLLKFTDTIFLNLPLAQAVGRWGNFFNYELYGTPTNLPWAVKIPPQYRMQGYEPFSTFHPVFLYEAVLDLFNWFILLFVSKKPWVKDGTITLLFLVNYGFIRLLTNLVRIDKEFIFTLETSDIFSIMFIAMSLFALFIIYANNRHEKRAAKVVSYGLSAYLTAILPVILAAFVDRNIVSPWVTSLFIILLPVVLLAIFFKLGLINDFDISDRSKRPLFMLCLSLLYLLFYIWVSTTGSLLLIKVTLALLIVSMFFTVISTFWKISGHMTYLLFAITSVNFMFLNPMLLYLYLLVPIVAWARVKLKAHSPMQTILGTATAMVICLSLFYLI